MLIPGDSKGVGLPLPHVLIVGCTSADSIFLDASAKLFLIARKGTVKLLNGALMSGFILSHGVNAQGMVAGPSLQLDKEL